MGALGQKFGGRCHVGRGSNRKIRLGLQLGGHAACNCNNATSAVMAEICALHQVRRKLGKSFLTNFKSC